jgi:hypothetical protein
MTLTKQKFIFLHFMRMGIKGIKEELKENLVDLEDVH